MIVVILFLAVSVFTVTMLVRRLRRDGVKSPIWLMLAVCLACGASVGVWSSLSFAYPAGPETRFGGFPIPDVFYHLEQGRWVDYGVPEFQAWSTVVANAATIATLAASPLWLYVWLRKKGA